MAVKSFKFVSPGVFINEIDNSFIPKSAEAIGPVVIGRATRGLAMQPVTVQSYSDFVEMFGETVPGMGGGDIYRNGNFQSPMYGTYAAKAFLNANVAPLTYIRLLGQQSANKSSTTNDAAAGWRTLRSAPTKDPGTNGGAYGLWLFTSQSNTAAASARLLGTASLAAVWYLEDGHVTLSGTIYGDKAIAGVGGVSETTVTASNNVVIGTDSNNQFTVVLSGTQQGSETIKFGFDDSQESFIRNRFNTNPQLSSGSTFYSPGPAGSGSAKSYWLGETYEQELRDRGLTTASLGVILALYEATDGNTPASMKAQASTEAKAGWFIGQDLGAASGWAPHNSQRLFRLVGRGHGEWLQKNAKVSISNVRRSTSTTTDYGTFSLLIRSINDTDNNVQVMERFDNLNLDPTSPNYIARVIGDKYTSWDSTERRLKTYGDYDNQSKFVYVEMNNDVEAGGTDATYLPFGYFSPPRFRAVYDLNNTGAFNLSPGQKVGDSVTTLTNMFVTGGSGIPNHSASILAGMTAIDEVIYLSGGVGIATGGDGATAGGMCTGSLIFPSVRLRNSASDGGLSDVTDAYFGMQTTRTATSTTTDNSIGDFHRLLYSGYAGGGSAAATSPYSTTGVEDYAYIFSLDNIVLKSGTTDGWYYSSGSRTAERSYSSSSYGDLLDAQINSFTAPFFGGFDGFDIKKPDPLYNADMGSTEDGSYRFHTYKRAIDTIADPEFLNMNLLAIPGLTVNALTTQAVRVCEERADALALIDLPNVYIPAHEAYKASKANRIGTTAVAAANALRDRIIDSSYGCTFYPWVQTRDDTTGAMLWVPPSVAMMGVLASSEAASQIWFAPAGFNRGGLSEGAAGIPVTGVTQRLTSKERDTLYEANINPIASFPSSGIVVFGQKTLQERQSALDRINVRRLVIYLKKQISILSTQILFEQNVQATWNRFTSLVEPFLSNVKTNFGITDYRLILDESTTTPDLIDQNILYAKIMIKPARAIEYIAIDFVIMSTGASFDD